MRNAAKRPRPYAIVALDAESRRHSSFRKEQAEAERRAPEQSERIAETWRKAAARQVSDGDMQVSDGGSHPDQEQRGPPVSVG